MVATLDALGELHLLCGRQERDAPDVLEEELERVRRDLGVGLGLALDLLLDMDDRDLSLVERGVELVELAGLEIELVEREGDLVCIEPAGLEPRFEQTLSFVGREDVLDRCSNRRALGFPCDQSVPLARRRSHRSHRGGRRQSVQPCALALTRSSIVPGGSSRDSGRPHPRAASQAASVPRGETAARQRPRARSRAGALRGGIAPWGRSETYA